MERTSPLLIVFFLCLFSVIILSMSSISTSMAKEPENSAADDIVHVARPEALISDPVAKEPKNPVAGESAAVHIVHVTRPEAEDPEAFHIRTLASVVGSEEAAREAVIYHYTHAASGFAARLTPKQVTDLSQVPGVLQVLPDRIYELHSPAQPGRISHMGIM